MSEQKNCPNCGAELGTDAPDGLCPTCLMDNAAWSQTIATPGDSALAPTIDDSSADHGPSQLPEIQPTGSELGGYRILGLLGRGGMGAVYEAEQLESGRRVALKILSHRLDSEDARRRFIREGRLAASINHPNSVYVFGTEEIEGRPAITMEIVPGGTLQEKVRQEGPLPISKGVDAILQIVAGLESAQAIGILHRDVKPSNCFLDEHGVAKIGDFGLSISTEGHGDSHLTIQGSLLGTPAFSSPEQLRGDELHARSDMYSVGATLFYLLTGHAPFEEENMVKLLSRVLEETPSDPSRLRSEIPRKLARVIVRCLAKAPSDRFKSYADLRKALEPFSSQSPTPATLVLRFGGYLLDSVILGIMSFAIQALAWGDLREVFNQANQGSIKFNLIALGVNLLMILYFGFTEGLHGASPGKRLVGLRLRRSSSALAGFPRAALRAGVMLLILSLPYWVATSLDPKWMMNEHMWQISIALALVNVLTLGLLFCTARRHNGYAGLHGLLTDTRVVRAPAKIKRPLLPSQDSSPAEPLEGAERVGPYHIIEALGDSPSGRWFLAYDTRLLRRIWVHEVEAGTPAVPATQRNLHRASRLRWITGRRMANENWDAFEAPEGRALSNLTNGDQSWNHVRFWLLDLSAELQLAELDGTVPEILALNRVWITSDGHAKLLDFPAPSADPSELCFQDPDSFLQGIATAALKADGPPLPHHVGALLENPVAGDASMVEALWKSVRRPAFVSRRRRLMITLCVSAFPLVALIGAAYFSTVRQASMKEHPQVLELGAALEVLRVAKTEEERKHVRQFIAAQHRDIIESPNTWTNFEVTLLIDPARRRQAQRIVKEIPPVDLEKNPNAYSSAYLRSENGIRNHIQAIQESLQTLPEISLLIVPFTLWISYGALPSFLMALIARRGLLFTIFGVVVVTKNGELASRLRALWRSLIAWSPFFLVIPAAALLPTIGAMATTAIVATLILCLTVLSHLCPGRSLPDRMAGTWLVPK